MAIAQSVVIDEFTGERRSRATSIYMMGVGIPPSVALYSAKNYLGPGFFI